MGSVDTSISDSVTIIVKAPNQQIADQTIQCHLNWSIKKLKNYLSEVYPSKPKMEEQKLIYSGKLLTDSTVLKDILRMYEGQENHTVHLVCTSKSQKFSKAPASTNSNSSTRNDGVSSNTSPSEPYRDTSQSRPTEHVMGNARAMPVGGHAPFLDQLNVNQFSANNFDPRYFWPSATAFVNVNEADVNQQFAYMQQAYAQYISQYMQMMGQPGLGYMTSHLPQPVSITSQTSPLPNNNGLPRDRANQERNQARDNQPAVGAVGNDIDEEDGRNNRDWLDWFYVFSRIVILFSVVYFYSTPLRLLAVLLLVCMFYLHQNMRLQNEHLNLNLNNNNNNNVINHNNQNNNENRIAAAPAAAAPENIDAGGLRQRRPQESANAAAVDGVTPAPAIEPVPASSEPAAPPVPERLSPIAVTLLAIRTFFLSLVPDQPVV